MTSMGELESLVGKGELQLVSIVGVPRSVSTALGRSAGATEGAVVYLNEPFNRLNNDLEVTANRILEAHKEMSNKGSNLASVVVVKNMASYMSADSYSFLEHASGGTVWSVRNPLVQMGSLLTRIANDLVVGPGAETIGQDQILPYLGIVCDFLRDSEKSVNFSKTGWGSIYAHFCASSQGGFAVDGDELIRDPENVVRRMCEFAGLVYAPRMVEDWGNDFRNLVNEGNPAESARSAWTSRAATSRGFHASSRPELVVSDLPEELRLHIEEVALPAYKSIRQLD